jgi:probable HAF family extracellular repeat protein
MAAAMHHGDAVKFQILQRNCFHPSMSFNRDKKLFGTAFVASLVWLAFQCALAQSYTIVDLGRPGNSGSYSDPHGINQSAGVIGEWEATNLIFPQAFLYSQGTNTSLGTVSAIAYGINNSNHIVGESGAVNYQAFLYANGVITDLGTIAGTYSVAWAINNSDQVVGESTTSNLPNPPIHAVWYHSGAKTDLGTLTNGDYSSAFGINDSNIIVGEASVTNAGGSVTYAFIFSSNNVMSSMPTLGGSYGSARAINNSGQIVGESAVASGDTHAFLYSGGSMTDLGTFGGSYSTASAINSAGQVVGYATTSGGDARAFLFKGTDLFDLNNLISPSSVCTNLISADGINDRGQITGSGFTASGAYHAFLLTPSVTLTAPTMLTNGPFKLTVQGVPGQQFILQATTNLTANWTPLSTNTAATGTLTCTDAAAANFQCRFYRARLLP